MYMYKCAKSKHNNFKFGKLDYAAYFSYAELTEKFLKAVLDKDVVVCDIVHHLTQAAETA